MRCEEAAASALWLPGPRNFSMPARWLFKRGFIAVTKDDLEVAHLTLEAGQRRCEDLPGCAAITFQKEPDSGPGRALWIYMKADTTVTENGAWASYIKRPAGLLKVEFANRLGQVDVCWVDADGGRAAPSCYGSVPPQSSKSMSSFPGHYFVMKRHLWSRALPANAAQCARRLVADGRRRAKRAARPPLAAPSSTPRHADPTSLTVHNAHERAVELCSSARWTMRLQHTNVPVDLEVCHGVAPAFGSLKLWALPPDSALLARELAGVARIEQGVRKYSSEVERSPHAARSCLPRRQRAGSGACVAEAAWRADGGRLPPAGTGAPWALLNRLLL